MGNTRVRIVVTGVVLGLLAACTGQDASPPVNEEQVTTDNKPTLKTADAGPWVEPQWMTVRRQYQESFVQAQKQCEQAGGWDVPFDPNGNQSWSGWSDEDEDAYFAVKYECSDAWAAENPAPDSGEADLAYWQLRYLRFLDTIACLEAEGYELPDPPTEETFIDQNFDENPGPPQAVDPSTYYIPFKELETKYKNEINQERYYELTTTCQQNGPAYFWFWP